MRKIDSLENKNQLETIQYYLYYHDIETFSYEDPSDFDLWVLNDNEQQRAKSLILKFNSNPNSADCLLQVERGKKQYFKDVRQEKIDEKKTQFIDVRKDLFRGNKFVDSPYTMVLILVCCSLFFLQFFDNNYTLKRIFWISQDFVGNQLGVKSFYEIWNGEIWRLITPALLHHDLLHLGFNMWWLYQLGGKVEKVESRFFYIVLLLVIAAFSNVAYYLVAGPNFEGMSGVIYGLVGYLWAKESMGLRASYGLDPSLVRFFIIWYIFCLILTFFGFHIANTVHGVGAVMGIFLGLLKNSRKKSLNYSHFLTQDSLYTAGIVVTLVLGGAYIDHVTYFR